VNSLWFLSSLPDASGKSLLRMLGFGYMLSPMVAYTLGIIMQAIPARVIPGRLRLARDSQRNTVTGAEVTIVEQAMALMLRYTLFDNPLPNPVALTSQIYTVWGKSLETISDAGNIEPSEESVKQVS